MVACLLLAETGRASVSAQFGSTWGQTVQVTSPFDTNACGDERAKEILPFSSPRLADAIRGPSS